MKSRWVAAECSAYKRERCVPMAFFQILEGDFGVRSTHTAHNLCILCTSRTTTPKTSEKHRLHHHGPTMIRYDDVVHINTTLCIQPLAFLSTISACNREDSTLFMDTIKRLLNHISLPIELSSFSLCYPAVSYSVNDPPDLFACSFREEVNFQFC
jgi:hypothetical protein